MSHNYRLENFFCHKGNEVAFLASKKIIEFPGQVFNPFYLYGAKGLGKTHLLSALNDELSKKFVTHFLSGKGFEKSIEENRTFDSPLIIDDVHVIRDEYKDRLFEIVEHAVAENIQVCMSANVVPRDVKQFNPRFCSLIESGLICELFPPDAEDSIDIIKKKADQSGIIIPDEVAETLTQVGTGSISTICNMINRLVTYSSLGDLPSDVDTVRSILKEFYPKKKVCTTPSILETVVDADIWELKSTRMPDLRLEYEKKTYAWQLRGINVSHLKEKISDEAVHLKEVFTEFTKRTRRLLELQRIFQDRVREMERTEALRIEAMIFDPGKVRKIEELLAVGMSPARTFKKFVSFIIGASNREIWHKYHEEVLENLGSHNPCIIIGRKGTGKTHFLEAVCDDLLSRGKSVAFFDLMDRKKTLEPEEIEQYDVLLLDNFPVTYYDHDRLDDIISVVERSMATGKQIFIGTLPIPEDAERNIKALLGRGLVLEFGPPSVDMIIEYVRRSIPGESESLIAQGLPGFDSFHELEYYLKSLGEGESMVVPLGLPGEELAEEVEARTSEPPGAAHEIDSALRLDGRPAEIIEGANYVIPDLFTELVEETF